nr:hypothetical protein BHI3_16200 [Bacteriovorax sp. HI3]
MEANKKQLVIIPPMSEALKKLNEVLEGISTDENIEITLIDDLKELSQFIATTGQCLILASNAKKCATFLQDNRFTLAKNHCKTILFTPKEIPAKTMVKLAKIGLTESILESSPPKTFLYKVKLLLRSIKTTKPQEEGDKLVKSLDVAARPQEELQEKEGKERAEVEENVIDMDMGKKKKSDVQDDNAFDYSNPLKGKIKPQEENLDTHWKSNRKKDIATGSEDDAGNMAAESEQTSIDMYYRGKQKKNDTLPVEEEEEKTKSSVALPEEEEEKKRKSSYADVIDEGSMKQKRFDRPEEEEIKKDKVQLVELDLIESKKKKDLRENIEEETIPLFNRDKRKNIEPEAKEKEREDNAVEDLGGYLKGKISQIEEEEEPEITATQEQVYDNSEKGEKEPQVNLELEAGDSKRDNRKNDEEANDNDPHEGEVDKIDGNMIGDASTVEKIRTRMEGKSSGDDLAPPEEEESLDLFAKKRSEKENEEKDKEEQTSLDLDKNKKEKEAAKAKEVEEELEMVQKASKLAPLLEGKEREKSDLPIEEEKERSRLSPIEKLESIRERREAEAKREEEKKGQARENTNLDLEKSKNQTHTGQVDKIDTFYRSGEANKKKDQNWDNLTDKNTTLDLIPGKGKKGDNATQAKENNDLGEMTIDYRKLKEEFDMIAMGENVADSGAIRSSGENKLKNDDDEGSFKVVEIDPKSLDFSISIINSIYQKDTKAKQIFAMLAMELLENYHAYPVFYTYKLSDKKFSESYNTFLEVSGDKMPADKKEWWLEKKKDTALFEHFQEKSMNTWRCPEIIQNNEVWEDVELPTWAENELKTKYVELAFPYFDGLDRMGLAVVFFPEGVDPKTANAVLVVLEMARTLFLDTIQRYQVQPVRAVDPTKEEEAPKIEEKKNVLSFFSGLFGKKKAG